MLPEPTGNASGVQLVHADRTNAVPHRPQAEAPQSWSRLHIDRDVVGRPSPTCIALSMGQLRVGQRQGVMLAGIEIRKLVDAIENVANQFLQKEPRRDPYAPA